ncbi:LLM class flavin-dependent oxidoreductase [Nonomuraea sp. NBC_01738]|uniref:LLM class flavin-dependent oxidoreductase n=1 Tax=Nonomuraea sp. NBC_01738 TaxID=2976003 RepID=UPI002E146115|nr:LLM class flavin-dependent oxidoreductase [Nonomuraea sp. NBC_01738]
MTDFGYFLVPNSSDPLVGYAQLADRLGLDLIGIQDHPYQRAYVDTWTLLSVIAASTGRVTVFPDVASLPLRNPAVLAKAAASLDLLSGGRVALGLGAGAFWDAIDAYGGPRRTPKEALGSLDEAITVIRAIWSGGRDLRFEGEHFHLRGAQAGPRPAHDMGIWLGVGGPLALELLGRRADGWLPSSTWATPGKLAVMNTRIDEAALEAGRRPSDIRRLYNVNGVISTGASQGFLNGPVDQWVEELTDLTVGYGVDGFLLWAEGDQVEQITRFAEEVVPEVRIQVELEGRGGAGKSPG